jgi:hypothetical protein
MKFPRSVGVHRGWSNFMAMTGASTKQARAQSLGGLKAYVTNAPSSVMPAADGIAKYHDLWQVEKSFRMSKTDLDDRPVFNRLRGPPTSHQHLPTRGVGANNPYAAGPPARALSVMVVDYDSPDGTAGVVCTEIPQVRLFAELVTLPSEC